MLQAPEEAAAGPVSAATESMLERRERWREPSDHDTSGTASEGKKS